MSGRHLLPGGLIDAAGGLWIDGQRVAVVRPVNVRPRTPTGLAALRARLEAAIERAMAELDAIDAQTEDLEDTGDLEPACEDEGAQCEDEGADDEREPEETDWSYGEMVDQRSLAGAWV